MSRESAQRILAAVPSTGLSSDHVWGALRDLREKIDSLKETIESLESPSMFESMTRKEAANFLRVHPQRLAEFELLGLKYYAAGKGHTYIRRELIDFRENVLRGLRGLTIRVSKPVRSRVAVH